MKMNYAKGIAGISLKKNYDPDQPRVPAGSAEGGQWSDEEEGGSTMNVIKKVSLDKNYKGEVVRVHVEYMGGRRAYFDIREDENGKRRIFSKPALISQDEIAEVKAIAKIDGKWTEYGYDEERKRHQEMIDKVARGEAEYIYDKEGLISGIVSVTKKKGSNLFDTAHGLEG